MVTVEINAEAIPTELKQRDQWLHWDASAETPRQPHREGDFHGVSWSDPDDWMPFDKALSAARDVDSWGVGYVMALENSRYPRGIYGCLDLDGCVLEEGRPKDWLPDLGRFLEEGGYAEYSPSGDGIHIPIVGHEPPEWWSDSHFSQEEHEGVEYLTNKFVTFTGNDLDAAGHAVAEVDPTPFLFDAYTETNGESPRLEPSDDPEGESRAYDDEWLDEDAVEEALSNIDPDVSYPMWRNIGFAIHDFDSSTRGKQLFESWSRKGSKYDGDAERYVDAIWDSSEPGDGVTVATLIHHAKDNGWQPPNSSGAQRTKKPQQEVDDGEVERGEKILQSETTRDNPAGRLEEDGGCYGHHEVIRDKNGDVKDTHWNQETNFTLETLSYIKSYEGELLNIRVHPSHPMGDSYDVQVHPKVFNEPRTFREEMVRGRTTRFEPKRDVREVLNDLRETVGSQMAPQHVGTETIGLHGDDYDEWVTPVGTLREGGWAGDPTYVFYEKGGDQDRETSLEQKWELNPDEHDAVDDEVVRDIIELVPKTRRPSRGLPMMGWWYAAPLKPLIRDIEGEFNLLQVTGGTGAGKTSALEMFYQLFGADPQPFGCDDKGFTIEKKFSESRGLPIWLDEYKPSDIPGGKLDWLHRRLREVFRNKALPKGRSDLGEVTFTMQAPVVFSGEQTVQAAAVRRRTIMTNLSSEGTQGPFERAYCELVGATYTDDEGREHYPEGMDLSQHALAYYQYVLSLDPENVKSLWNECREETSDYLSDMQIGSLDESEFQGLRTIVFGFRLFEQFAQEYGVKTDQLPSESELLDALRHVAENIGPDGRRRKHHDEFTELLSQAASSGYLEEGVHHRVLSSQKFDAEVLAFHMPTAFGGVKKYLREFNLEDDYTILGKSDYVDSYADKAENEDSYALDTNRKVRGLDNGTKAVYIDVEKASGRLGDGFNPSAFTDWEDEEAEGGSDDDGADPISALADGDTNVTIEARALGVDSNTPDQIAEKAEMQDTTGSITATVWADASKPSLEEGVCYRFKNVSVSTFQGELEIQLNEQSGVKEISAGVGNAPMADSGESATIEEAAATDGGNGSDGGTLELARSAAEWVREQPSAKAKEEIVTHLVESEGIDAELAKQATERCIEEDGLLAPDPESSEGFIGT